MSGRVMAANRKGNQLMKSASAIARYLAGVIFLVFGLNGFLNFIPLPPPGGYRGTVHGRPVRLALPLGDLRVSGHRSGTFAGQPFCILPQFWAHPQILTRVPTARRE